MPFYCGVPICISLLDEYHGKAIKASINTISPPVILSMGTTLSPGVESIQLKATELWCMSFAVGYFVSCFILKGYLAALCEFLMQQQLLSKYKSERCAFEIRKRVKFSVQMQMWTGEKKRRPSPPDAFVGFLIIIIMLWVRASVLRLIAAESNIEGRRISVLLHRLRTNTKINLWKK